MRFSKAMKTGAGLVRLADGSLLSVADLPPRDTTRWVASRKLAVARAVLYQLRPQEEIFETYSISEEEFCAWVSCLAANGPSGLKITSRSNISR